MDINNNAASSIQKQTLLALVCVIASLVCFGLIKIGYYHWYFYLLAPAVLMMTWGVYLIVAENVWVNIITSFLVALASVVFFHSSALFYVWAVALLIFLIICRRDIKKELDNKIKIKAYAMVRDYVKWFLIFMSVLIGLIYFTASSSGKLNLDNIKLPESLRVDVLSTSLPEFSSSTTVDQLINMLNGRDVNNKVTPQDRAATLDAIGADNMAISGNSIAADNDEFMSLLVDKRLNQAIDKVGDFVPIVLGIIIWQLISAAYYLLLPIYLMLVELFFVILVKFGYIYVVKENTQKDVIRL